MSERIQTNQDEIREDTRNVGVFKEQLESVKINSEENKENNDAVEAAKDSLGDLKKTSLISVLEKHIQKNGTDINYREEYETQKAKGEIMNSGETGVITTATQIALKSLGIPLGKVDGIYGRRTQGAVNLFKGKVGIIDELGIGPKTIKEIINQLKAKTIEITEDDKNSLVGNQVPVNNDNQTTTTATTEVVETSKTTVIGIDSLDDITERTRKENTVKAIIIDGIQYGFFNNGEVRKFDKATKTYPTKEGKTEEFINKIKNIQEAENNKTPFNKDKYKTITDTLRKINKNILIYDLGNPSINISIKSPEIKHIGKINCHTIIKNNGEINQERFDELINKLIEENNIKEKKEKEETTKNKNITNYINKIKKKTITMKDLGLEDNNNMNKKTIYDKLGKGNIKFEEAEKSDASHIRVEIEGIDTAYNIDIKEIMNQENTDIDNNEFQEQVKDIISAEIKKLETA